MERVVTEFTLLRNAVERSAARDRNCPMLMRRECERLAVKSPGQGLAIIPARNSSRSPASAGSYEVSSGVGRPRARAPTRYLLDSVARSNRGVHDMLEEPVLTGDRRSR